MIEMVQRKHEKVLFSFKRVIDKVKHFCTIDDICNLKTFGKPD